VAQVHLFQCTKCNGELVGPLVVPGERVPQVGTLCNSGKPVTCKGLCKILSAKTRYLGVGDRIPNAPALSPGKPAAPKIPMKWEQASPDGPYVRSALFDAIPAVPQAALIAELDKFFEENQVPLLSAFSDRFDTYADPLDSGIRAGAKAAEKHLTTTMVLTRLNAVLKHIDGKQIAWGPTMIDRPQFAPGCALTLPFRLTHANTIYQFHDEVLNDLVNPREGHAIVAEEYFKAICKAIELARANVTGQTSRGPNHGYYFWSSAAKRGINVVLKRDTREILTIYYCGAANAWWNLRTLSADLRLERTL
jgi:hypothetical protein